MKTIFWTIIPLAIGAFMLVNSTNAVTGVIEGLSAALGAK